MAKNTTKATQTSLKSPQNPAQTHTKGTMIPIQVTYFWSSLDRGKSNKGQPLLALKIVKTLVTCQTCNTAILIEKQSQAWKPLAAVLQDIESQVWNLVWSFDNCYTCKSPIFPNFSVQDQECEVQNHLNPGSKEWIYVYFDKYSWLVYFPNQYLLRIIWPMKMCM